MRSLGRGLVALLAAVVVALSGGGLAVGLANANPSPQQVLSDAREFVGRSTSLRYTASITTELPVGGGAQLVRRLQVSGAGVFGGGWDYITSDGTTLTEVRSIPEVAGVLVRSGSVSDSLSAVRWERVGDLAGLDDAIARAVARASGTSYDPAAVQAVVLSDELAAAETSRRIITAGRSPRRRGNDAHEVSVRFDPVLALGEGAAALIPPLEGTLRASTGGAPERLVLTARYARASVSVEYRFTNWNSAVEVPMPAAADISQ